jgi:hypothetical protein
LQAEMTKEVAMDSTQKSNLHIVCLPFMAAGHIVNSFWSEPNLIQQLDQ